MAKWTINNYNIKINRSATVTRIGRNGVWYEYILLYGSNPLHWATEADDVKSRKRSLRYKNGKRPGQYQPVGDKRFFGFYQAKAQRSANQQNVQVIFDVE